MLEEEKKDVELDEEKKTTEVVPPSEPIVLDDDAPIVPDQETIEAADEAVEETVDVEEITPEALEEAIVNKNKAELIRIFETVPDVDIAEACDEIEVTSLIRLFRMMKAEMTAELFEELSQDKKEELIRGMTDKELVSIINEQYADDIADTVGDMPANLAMRVLKAADKEMRAAINTLLKYQEDTAGAVMTTEYLEFREDMDVKTAIKQIRSKGKDAETVYTIFVRDAQRKFVGTVDLDDLIFAKEDEKLGDIMNCDIPTVQANTDKEEVANLFRRYNDMKALAVLNDEDRLVGVVTVDDAIDVMVEETTEDIESMNAVSALEDSYLETKPWDMAKKCFPWLIILMVLGTFSSMVLSRLEDTLGTLAVLTAFITVLMDTGGNSGGQTIALMIRGLSLREFGPEDFGKIIWKELRSSLITAAIVGVFGMIWFTMEQMTGIVINSHAVDSVIAANGLPADALVTIWQGNIWSWTFFLPVLVVSAAVSLTLFAGIIFSKVLAIVLPLVTAALKKDPAVIAQPILTTIIDVSSLLLFFAIAQLLVFPLLGL
ncbi:MAG: magnesium transporter [Bacilli bacterium]|nr:magnesium transporter [Bacilli bacterium]